MRSGTLKVLAAYGMWGVLPIYWKVLEFLPSGVILAHRIIWALAFTAVLVPLLGQGRELRQTFLDRRVLNSMVVAALLISFNWWLYIWAVINGRILESAFGYYTTPIVSVLLGIFFQKERLTRSQKMAFGLAGIGVATMAAGLGGVPWVSLALCTSFGIYGLIKKRATVPPLPGLLAETLLSLPLALALLAPAALRAASAWGTPAPSLGMKLFCLGAGPATAVPLWLFASGARRITMVRLGFAQYLSPTLSFLVGLFLYHEPFGPLRALAFVFIWSALAVFMIGELLARRAWAPPPTSRSPLP